MRVFRGEADQERHGQVMTVPSAASRHQAPEPNVARVGWDVRHAGYNVWEFCLQPRRIALLECFVCVSIPLGRTFLFLVVCQWESPCLSAATASGETDPTTGPRRQSHTTRNTSLWYMNDGVVRACTKG